jgi:transcriptional regulator with XRE-family HTH domain
MVVFDGSKLRKLREGRKLRRDDLATLVGRKYSHIANYENGVATPPSDVLLSLMQFFGVSAKELSKAPEGEPV